MSSADTFCIYDSITDRFFGLVVGFDDETGRTAHGAWYDEFRYWYSNPLVNDTGGVFTAWQGPVTPTANDWGSWLDGYLEIKRALVDIEKEYPDFDLYRLFLVYVDDEGYPDFATRQYSIKEWEKDRYESL